MSEALESGTNPEASAVAPVGAGTDAQGAAPVPTRMNYEEWKAHWKRLVDAWLASGLSQSEFCRQHQLVESTFNGWKRKFTGAVKGPRRIREPRCASPVRADGHARADAPSGPVGQANHGQALSPFVPVRVAAGSASASWSVEVVCANGRILRLRERIEPKDLARWVAALES